MAAAPPLTSFDVFQTQTEAACNVLADKLGKDVCMYTGLKVPTSEQVKLVLLTPKGTPRVVKLSCFCNAEALHLFVKDLGKGLCESESKRLLLVNGVSKVANKERYNTVRQVATARGKCSPFLSAEELQALEDARKAFIKSEQASAAAAKEKAKVDAELAKAAAKTKKAEEKAVAQVEGAAEETPKKKRSPKRKVPGDAYLDVSRGAEVTFDDYFTASALACELPIGVEVVCDTIPSGVEASPKPKAKRVKKDKAPKKLPEILGVAPDESLSALGQWSGMAL